MFPNNLPATTLARQLLMRATAALMRTDLDVPQNVNPSVTSNFASFSNTTGGLKDSGKSPSNMVYSLEFNMLINISPTNGSTIIFGNSQGASLSTGRSQIYFPMAGKLVAADVHVIVNTTLGSGETGSAYIRVNNTTDYLISSSLVWNTAGRVSRYLVSNLSADITTSDYFELKVVHPTWLTTPTNVRYYGHVLVQS